MTRPQLERYVRVWQKRLGLERWHLTFKWDEPCDPDKENAKVRRSNLYDRADIFFASDFAGWTPDFAEKIVVHELLHLTHRDIDEVVADLDGQLHRDAFTMVERRYEQVMEQFIDRLACRLVEFGG